MTKPSWSNRTFRVLISIFALIILTILCTVTSVSFMLFVASIIAVVVGAVISDRIFSRKDRHIEFLEHMETVNKAINKARNVEEMLFNVLSAVKEILKTDRAWLLYPCDPNADSWKIPMEVTDLKYPGAMGDQAVHVMSDEARQLFSLALDTQSASFIDYRNPSAPQETAKDFAVLTQLHIPLFPKSGSAWLFGVHQCSYAKVWDTNEIQLFTEISRRISDGLTSLLYLQNLSESEHRNRIILDSTAEAIYGIDLKGNCVFCNAACLRILGLESQTELIGKNMQRLIHRSPKSKTKIPDDDALVGLALQENKKCHVDSHLIYRPNGSSFPAEYWSHPIVENGEVSGCVVTFLDITDRRQKEAELRYQASHDSLTGLLNRPEFEKRLGASLQTLDDENTQHAMFFLGLDQFKVVNDSCGHTAGDGLLRQISSVLSKCIAPKDILARIGGDEFAILIQACTLEQATYVAEQILSAVNDYKFVWDDKLFHIQISIGVIPIVSNTQLISELFIQADAACYLAKDAGRNRIHFYHPDDVDMAQRHGEIEWVSKLYSALDDNRFVLYAQQIVPVKSSQNHQKYHFELLLRMKSPLGKIIAPGNFLPAAERYDIIQQLDKWVIKKGFTLLSESAAFLEKTDFVSINLSGKSLSNPKLIVLILKCLEETQIDANKICFEITETAAILNFNNALKFINELKLKGFRFALDDFGTGLSSFEYLKKMPVDFVKIDGLFVKEITNNPIDYQLVKSINGIGHVMGMKTIAEFVENDAILEKLVEIGIDYAQGYGIGKPVPFESLLTSMSVKENKNRSRV